MLKYYTFHTFIFLLRIKSFLFYFLYVFNYCFYFIIIQIYNSKIYILFIDWNSLSRLASTWVTSATTPCDLESARAVGPWSECTRPVTSAHRFCSEADEFGWSAASLASCSFSNSRWVSTIRSRLSVSRRRSNV